MWESRIHNATSPTPGPELLFWAQAMEDRGPEPSAVLSKPVLLEGGIPVPKQKTDGNFPSPEIPTEQIKLGLSHSSGFELFQSFFFFTENLPKMITELSYFTNMLHWASVLICFFCLAGIFLKEVNWGHLIHFVFFPGFQRWSFQIPSNSPVKNWFICFRLSWCVLRTCPKNA